MLRSKVKNKAVKTVKEATSEISDSDGRDIIENTDLIKDFTIDDDGLIHFQQNSLLRPKRWCVRKKLIYTILYGLGTFAAQFNSTTMASELYLSKMNEAFGIGRECATLGTSLYVLGIGFGPMIFAPLSEMYGRKLGVFIPLLISALFTFVVALSYNVPGIMVSRFLAGFCSGAPVVSAGGVLADIWSASARGGAMGLYAMFVASGPSFGPIISSLLIDSSASPQSWRIPQWFIGLVELVLFLGCMLTLEETYEPVILSKQAKKLKIKTHIWKVHALQDELHLDLKETVTIHFVRPFAMLATPIVFLMALFASYVYGIFYLMLTNISQSYTIQRGWTGTVSELPLIGWFLGSVVGCVCNIWWGNKYAKYIRCHGNKPNPEERLPIMMMTGWLMPAGIFAFGWSNTERIPWIVSCIFIVVASAGFLSIFQNCLNYLVDSFPRYSASAIAANTFLRSVFGAIFPLFAKQLFTNLGVGWGSTLIGFIALGMIPIPFYFYKKGETIRAKNPYASRVN